jgi:signal transduction histidine kinase
VSSSAHDALREQIVRRLRSTAEARALVLDEALRTVTLRARDFASDGLVRGEAARLAALPGPPSRAEAEALRRHLAENKLPIVPAFVDLVVVGVDGRRLAGVGDGPPPGLDDFVAASRGRDGEWVGSFAPVGPDGVLCFGLATPVLDLARERRVGVLVCWVDAARWIAGVPLAGGTEDLEDLVVAVEDASGAGFESAHAAPGGPAVVRTVAAGTPRARPTAGETLSTPSDLSVADWRVVVEMGTARALEPVAGLQSRFFGAGLLIALANAVLLFFPLGVLVKPLGRLRDAARRVSDGDFTGRVDVESKDEVGDLAAAFNVMTEAVRDRTRRLEQTAADLEARKDELSHERDRLDAMVRSMQDPLVFFDAEGHVQLSNRAAEPLLPFLSGAGGRDLALRCARGEGTDERDCVACLARGDLPKQSCRLEVGARVYEVLATRIPTAGGWLGRLLVARDITELVTFDERQTRQERLAVLGEIAAVVAHELNNPLSAIAMYAQMMASGLPAGSPFHEHIDVVRRNTETCSRAVRGSWTRPTAPTRRSRRSTSSRRRRGRAVPPPAAPARRRGTRAEAHWPTPACARTRSSCAGLREPVMNAIQAVEGVGRHVRVVVGEADGGRTLVVDVCDDGPGIRPEQRERVFEPFFTTKPAGKGTGLGLPISRRIVEAHGGTLTLVSGEPGATTFRVRLPRASMVRPQPAGRAAVEGAP